MQQLTTPDYYRCVYNYHNTFEIINKQNLLCVWLREGRPIIIYTRLNYWILIFNCVWLVWLIISVLWCTVIFCFLMFIIINVLVSTITKKKLITSSIISHLNFKHWFLCFGLCCNYLILNDSLAWRVQSAIIDYTHSHIHNKQVSYSYII